MTHHSWTTAALDGFNFNPAIIYDKKRNGIQKIMKMYILGRVLPKWRLKRQLSPGGYTKISVPGS